MILRKRQRLLHLFLAKVAIGPTEGKMPEIPPPLSASMRALISLTHILGQKAIET